jgi:hypothetical protein
VLLEFHVTGGRTESSQLRKSSGSGLSQCIASPVRGCANPSFSARSEGHSFRKRSNRDKFYQAMASFFAEHLLGDPTPVVELELEDVPTATPTDDPTEPAEGEAE